MDAFFFIMFGLISTHKFVKIKLNTLNSVYYMFSIKSSIWGFYDTNFTHNSDAFINTI
jgi:hypothetical protein